VVKVLADDELIVSDGEGMIPNSVVFFRPGAVGQKQRQQGSAKKHQPTGSLIRNKSLYRAYHPDIYNGASLFHGLKIEPF
jgi:hypothetical protein